MDGIRSTTPRGAWNKGKLVGQKAPFKLQEVWAIRIRLQTQGRLRDLALFDLGIAPQVVTDSAPAQAPLRWAWSSLASTFFTSGSVVAMELGRTH